jgi:YegS/Rv2252/BmrU family lipid kinase
MASLLMKTWMEISDKKNIAIVCNALAGAGMALPMTKKIAEALLAANITYMVFYETWPNGFDGFTDIFIVGGDGTLNYFINQYPDIHLPLVLFKGGTGNDFHWLLYGDQTLEEQLQIALNATPKPIDVGKCNERYFINGLGIGFEGAVVKDLSGKKKRPGKASFFISILKNIFSYHSKFYTVESVEKTLKGKMFLVDISNGRRTGGGFHITPDAKADDGLLDVLIAKALHPLQRLFYLPVIEKGKHLHLSVVHHYHTKQIKIVCDELVSYHLDGEYGEAKDFEIQILAGAVSFRY